MKICIVIPIYNESQEIGRVIESIKEKGIDVIVVDDGSTDQSGAIIRDSGAIVISNKNKNGKGYSLQKGFSLALEKGYEGVVAMDGDGQHDIDDLGLFLKKAQEDPKSIVTGNRMHSTEHMPWVRRMTNRFLSYLVSKICRQSVPDSQCGYRYIHSEILRQLALESNNYQIETEVLIKSSRLGFPIHSVPIKTIYNDEESKINPFKDTIRFIIYLFKELRL